MRWFFPIATIAALLASCAVHQQVSLNPDGSGTAVVRIRLEKVYTDYIRDLAAVGGEAMKDNSRIFKVEEIEKSFAKREDLELKRIASPSPERLELELGFRSIDRLFAGNQNLEQAGVISYKKNGEATTIKLHLDRKNFAQVTELAPLLKNPLFEGLGPQENDDTTEAEYYELIDLALGKGGAAALKASLIEITITVPGKIITQTGGTAEESSVTFRIPLIRVLLLDKPLDYSLTYR